MDGGAGRDSNECGALPRNNKHFHIATGKTERAQVVELSRSGIRKLGKGLLFYSIFKLFFSTVRLFFLRGILIHETTLSPLGQFPVRGATELG